MTIHREGFKIIPYAILILTIPALAASLISPIQTPLHWILYSLLFFLAVITIRFFRSPDRIPADTSAGAVLSSVDGTVVAIEETVESEYFKDKRLLISVFMSVNNVHINFSPFAGEVTYIKYHPGKFMPAWEPKSSLENERNTYVVKNEMGIEVLLRQIAGTVARRIATYANVGDTLQWGDQLGFIRFGSRVDIFLPLGSEVKVALKQKVKGQESILAYLPR
ncbi:MAG: phosphatidylserine decarboxylase family protein [Bacteroidales bacterium]|jgi:phosphatidylserine decarboxylase|nr:phosphatidylserine decarboxylase family protein [Bacteroidales bacterium]